MPGIPETGRASCKLNTQTIGTTFSETMIEFTEWPTWAQVALVVPLVMSYVPVYFVCVLINQCITDGKAKPSQQLTS